MNSFIHYLKKNIVLKIVTCVFCIAMLSVNTVTANAATDSGQVIQEGDFDISVTDAASNTGAARIDWSGYSYADKYFRVYKKAVYSVYNTENVSESYASIGIDYKQVDRVKVLQIYPNGTSAGNWSGSGYINSSRGQIWNWVNMAFRENATSSEYSYSSNIISVSEVDNNSFNANPGAYLRKDSNGKWTYDVVFYGTWDSNNNNDISVAAYAVLGQFATAGKGIIMGHDVATRGCNSRTISFVRTYFNQCMGITNGDFPSYGSADIKLTRTGLFTTYPYYIGAKGDVIRIPYCHARDQYWTNSSYRWAMFTGWPENSQFNHYMVTQGNFAMIQTGHSSGDSRKEERSLIANLCFYCNQMLFGSSYSTDYSATDYARPVVQNGKYNYTTTGGTCTWSAYDNGTTYDYYVQAFDKNDTTSSGVLATSDTVRKSISVGIDHYQYILDNNSSNYSMAATSGSRTYSTSVNISGTSTSDYRYLHVVAVDKAGNVSSPIVITVPPINLVVFDKNTPKDDCATWTVQGTMNNEDFLVNTNKALTRNAYTLSDWEFTGWNTKADGTGTSYSDGQTISFSTSGSTRLYAQWRAKEHTVTYNKNSDYVTSSSGLSATIRHVWANVGKHRVDVSTTNHWVYRPGWTFVGWAGGTEDTSVYTSGNSPILQTSNLTVYAIYKRSHTLNLAADSISGRGAYSFSQTIWNHATNFYFGSGDVINATTRPNVPYTVTFTHNGDDTFTSMGRTSMTTQDLTNDTIITERSLNGWYTAASSGTNVGTSGTDVKISVYEGADVSTKYNVMGNKDNTDIWSTNNSTTLYAHWNSAYIILPDADRNGYKSSINGTDEDLFLGWFSKPQPTDGGSGDGGIYYGMPGDTVEITADTVMYPWYNIAPVEVQSNLSSGFWEGQTVSYDQLMGLIDATDVDDRSSNATSGDIAYSGLTKWKDLYRLNVISYLHSKYPNMAESQINQIAATINYDDFLPYISKITYYCNGNDDKGNAYSDSVKRTQDGDNVKSNGLLTTQPYVGTIDIEFTLSDNGTNINNQYWPNSAITVTYDLVCNINYDVIPQIETNMVDVYSTDPSVTSSNIESILLASQTITDYEDDVTNAPWWYTDAAGLFDKTSYTRQQLIDTLYVVKIQDVHVASGYANEHSDMAERVEAIENLQELFKLKEGSEDEIEAFNHITEFEVIIDGHDQWGKYVSDADGDYTPGSGDPDNDPNNRRSFKVIMFNNFDDSDIESGSVSDKLRYASSDMFSTIGSDSYWGDEFYGKDALSSTFQKYIDKENNSISPRATYSALMVNSTVENQDREVNITVNDYSDKTTSTYTAPSALYPTYDGNEHVLIAAGTTYDGVMEYSLDGVNYSNALPSAVNAGSYTVYYRITGGTNDKSGQIQAVIQKADCDFVAPTAKELEYTGQPQELMTAGSATTGTLVYKVGSGEYGEALPTGVNVGNYTVYYKVRGDENHKDSDTYTAVVPIVKAPGELTAPEAIEGLVYTGSAQELVTRGGSSTGTVMYKLGNGPWSTQIPTAINDGNYTVSYKVVGDDNHEDVAEASVKVRIHKLAGNLTAPIAKEGLVYNGSAQALVNAGYTTTGILQYKLDNGTWSTTLPTAINAGLYKVGYRVIGDANHEDVDEAYITVLIDKAQGSSTTPSYERLVYNGKKQTLISAVTSTTGTVQYSLDNTNWTTEIPGATDAGFYDVYYKVVGDNNHYDMDVKSVRVEIAKADGVLKTPTANKLTYNGNAQYLVSIEAGSTGTVMYKLGDNGTWSQSIPTEINAGDYVVYYKLDADDNHISIDEDAEHKISVAIDKAQGRVVAPQARGLSYVFGESQELVDAGVSDTGTIMYKSSEDAAYTTDIPFAITAGTYTVWYKVVGDSNHYDVDEKTIEVTIGDAEGSIVAPIAKTLTYNGESQELVEAGTSETGVVYYRIGQYGEWSTDIPTAVNNGTYDVYYYSKAFVNAGYSDTKPAYVTSTISKAKINYTKPTPITGLIYNTKSQTLVNAGSTTTGILYYKIDNGSWTTAVPSATKPGTYKISYYVKGDSNHEDTKVESFNVTISNLEYTITYHANGGSGSMDKQTLYYDVTDVLDNNQFTRSGYQMLGWSTSADGNKVYDNMQVVRNLTSTYKANIDLYAVWTPAIDVTEYSAGTAATHDCSKYLLITYNGTQHWQYCSVCGKKFNATNHTFTDNGWTLGTANDCHENNVHKYSCNCGYSYTTTSGRASHVFNNSNLNSGYCTCWAQHKHWHCLNGCGASWSPWSGGCYSASGVRLGVCTSPAGTCATCGVTYGAGGGVHSYPEWVLDGTRDVTATVSTCKFDGMSMIPITEHIWFVQTGVGSGTCYVDITPAAGYQITSIDGTGVSTHIWGNVVSLSNYSCRKVSSTTWREQYDVTFKQATDVAPYTYCYCTLHFSNGTSAGCVAYSYSWYEQNAPVIGNITQKGLSSSGNWATQKQITVTGTEDISSQVYLTMKDSNGNTIASGTQSVSGKSWSWTFTPNIEADANGKTYTIIATDCCNNSSSKSFTVTSIDAKAPTITSGNPSTSWSTSKSYTLTATDEGSGNLTVQALNGSYESMSKNGTTYSKTYNYTGDVYGSIGMIYNVRDAVGNVSSKSFTIANIDNTNPHVTNVDIRNKKLTVTADDYNSTLGKDGSGVSYYGYCDVSKDTAITWKSSSSFSVPSSGTYMIFAKDGAGNISEPYTITIN